MLPLLASVLGMSLSLSHDNAGTSLSLSHDDVGTSLSLSHDNAGTSLSLSHDDVGTSSLKHLVRLVGGASFVDEVICIV